MHQYDTALKSILTRRAMDAKGLQSVAPGLLDCGTMEEVFTGEDGHRLSK